MLYLGLFLVVVVAFLGHWLWSWYGPRLRGFPPGPLGLPLLGNINLLRGSACQRHERFGQLGRLYGGVFSAKTGVARTVIVTSYKLFREANVSQTWEFAGRPDAMWMADETTNRYPGIVANSVSEDARNVRKFTLTALRSFGFGKSSMQDAILRECDGANEEFRKSAGIPLNPRNIVSNAAANVIGSVALGRTYKQGDPTLQIVNDAITDALKLVPTRNYYRMFPLLRYLPSKSRDTLTNNFQAGKTFLNRIIKEHVATHMPGEPRDFIDMWHDEQAKSAQSAQQFPPQMLPSILLDLFAAGFDTTATSLQWIFAMLVHHPEVQDKIHCELDARHGAGEQVTLEDRDALPYTEAVILETMRTFPVLPVAIPHQTTQDATLGQYHIPKGTRVIFHLYSIHHDPDLWSEPEEFRPERFIQDGVLKMPEFFVAFGAGRRSCLGEQLARKEVFLLLANILRCFRVVCPEGVGLPSLEPLQGGVMHPPPFKVQLEER